MTDESLEKMLESVLAGQETVAEAAAQLRAWRDASHTAELTDSRIDLDRADRCGFPEVVYAEGKSVETVIEIFSRLREAGHAAFATRVSDAQAAGLLESFPEARSNHVARTVRLEAAPSAPCGRVVVVTAGTSDLPVAEEAMETLRWMQCDCELIVDVGVAGPRRLLAQLPNVRGADAVIVVAGMEGALPSVVGGWVSCPVIAVPTSVGYGAAFGGLAALLGMLNSCASNVTVVNIDAGFKGAYVAGLIARRRHQGVV